MIDQTELDRRIAEAKKEAKSQKINLAMAISALIALVTVICVWPDDSVRVTVKPVKSDTTYIWYDHNGNGHIGFINHSKIENK